MAGPRVYIHELIDITGHQRAKYLHHVTANWGPVGREQRGQLCFGVWATVGSTGRWPQVVNLWEYADWAALGRNFEIELTGDGLQDPALSEWWAGAAELRSGGVDRILVAPDWAPSIADLCASARPVAAGYVHELVTCRAGSRGEFMRLVHDEAIARHADAGLDLVGAFRRAMGNDDEVVLIWSFADWDRWAGFESHVDQATSSPIGGWRALVADHVVGWDRIAMSDAPLSPLRTRRQPQTTDRRPLSDF